MDGLPLTHITEGHMFGLGVPELVIVLVLVLIVFGAGKLPELGSGLGSGIRNFKKGIKDDGPKPMAADPSSSASLAINPLDKETKIP